MSSCRRASSVLEIAAAAIVSMVIAGVAWYTAAGVTERGITDNEARKMLLQGSVVLELHFSSRGFLPTDAATALLVEPSLAWVDGAADGAGEISILASNTAEGGSVTLATPGKERCITVQLSLTPDSRVETRSSYTYSTAVPVCDAADAVADPGAAW